MNHDQSPSISVAPLPKLSASMLAPPSAEQRNDYQSASEIVKNLSRRIKQWNLNLTDGEKAAIYAILPGGIQIDIFKISAEGHDGLVIIGKMNESDVLITMHKSNFVSICMTIKDDLQEPRPEIGFHYQPES